MATLDDINILDRVKTDPQLLLQAGRQPTVERVKPTFNPASDYFYNNVLNDSGRRDGCSLPSQKLTIRLILQLVLE
jgi:hypothetical protein